MVKIENLLISQQITLTVFIDIEGAFDNTSTETIIRKIINHGKRNFEALTPPVSNQQQLQTIQDVKYLDVILVTKPLCNKHLQYITTKATKSLPITRQALGENWRLQLGMVLISSMAIREPKAYNNIYGYIVWWPTVEKKDSRTVPNKVQRQTCLCITSVIQSSSNGNPI